MNRKPLLQNCSNKQKLFQSSPKRGNHILAGIVMLFFLLQGNAGMAQTTFLTNTSEVVSPCTNCTAEDIKAVDFWLSGYGPNESSNCLDSGTTLNTGDKMIVQLNVTASQRYGLVMVANMHIDSSGDGKQPSTFFKAFKFCSNKTYLKGTRTDTISLVGLNKELKAGWRITIKDVFVAWDNNDFLKGNNKTAPCVGIDATGGSISYTTSWDCKYVMGNALTPHCKKQDEVFIIKVPTKPIIRPNPIITPVTCPNGSNGAINISVGPWFQADKYTYEWRTVGNSTVLQTGQDAINLTQGTYNVKVIANGKCSNDADFTVGTNPTLTFTKDSLNIGCKDSATGWARVNITGAVPATSFSWYPSNVAHTAYSNRDSAYHLTEGTYRDTIRYNNNQCYVVATFDLKGPSEALKIDYFTIHKNVICPEGNVGKASVHPIGGWRKASSPYYKSFSWSDNINFSSELSNTDTLRNRGAGTYWVKITDSLDCVVTGDTNIIYEECPPEPVPAVFCTKSQGYFGTDNPGKATYFNGYANSSSSTVAVCTPLQTETYNTLYNALNWWKNRRAPAPLRDSLKIGKVNLTAKFITNPIAAIQEILDYLPGGGPIETFNGTSLPPAYDPAGKAIPGNTLMAQTLALGLNIGINNHLDSFKLGKSLITEKVGGPCSSASGSGYRDTLNTAAFDGKYVIQIFQEASAAVLTGNNAQALAGIAGRLNEAFEDCREALAVDEEYDGGGGECSSMASRGLTNQESVQLFQLKTYPNPFTTSVNIGFRSPASGIATLEIFDVNGRRLEYINKGRMQAGQFTTIEYRPSVKAHSQLFYKITVGIYSVNGKLVNKQ